MLSGSRTFDNMIISLSQEWEVEIRKGKAWVYEIPILKVILWPSLRTFLLQQMASRYFKDIQTTENSLEAHFHEWYGTKTIPVFLPGKGEVS